MYFLGSCKETIMKFTDLFVTSTVTGVHRAMQFHSRRLTFERKTTVINNKFCWGGCGGPERSSYACIMSVSALIIDMRTFPRDRKLLKFMYQSYLVVSSFKDLNFP